MMIKGCLVVNTKPSARYICSAASRHTVAVKTKDRVSVATTKRTMRKQNHDKLISVSLQGFAFLILVEHLLVCRHGLYIETVAARHL